MTKTLPDLKRQRDKIDKELEKIKKKMRLKFHRKIYNEKIDIDELERTNPRVKILKIEFGDRIEIIYTVDVGKSTSSRFFSYKEYDDGHFEYFIDHFKEYVKTYYSKRSMENGGETI